VIIYRKGGPLRIRRTAVPGPPYWCASTIAPYSARRGSPISIDYSDLRASFSERLEVAVAENVTDELERSVAKLAWPVLIEASEFAESIFGRGFEALAVCERLQLPAIHLISSRGDIPERVPSDTTVVIGAWPLDFQRFERLFADAGARLERWGVAVPVIFPVTTNLAALDQLATLARENGADCFTALPVEVDATAKQAIANSLALEGDDETFEMLFHANLEPVHTATERHIAALAAEKGMRDFIAPPKWEERSNWNAAVLLTLTATRMIAMERDIELAGTMARSARVVADLEKPLTRIAEAASLSIVEAIDEVSADILTDWIAGGRSAFVERVDDEWRLRRDVGV
jgi:hypothetical protein